MVNGALQQLIGDVAGTLGSGQLHGIPESLPEADSNAFVTAPSPCPAGRPTSKQGSDAEEIHRLEGEEYEELMRALEASLLEDRLQEEAAYVEMLEQQEVQGAVEAYLSHSSAGAQQAQQQPGGEVVVLCPLCRQAFLVQHRGVILCPRQDLRLDVALERLSLEDLRHRLDTALQAHGRQGCGACPQFVLQSLPEQQQLAGAGAGMLCLVCHQCNCIEVVL